MKESWKMLWGPGKSWKSPGIFCKQESGNPVRALAHLDFHIAVGSDKSFLSV